MNPNAVRAPRNRARGSRLQLARAKGASQINVASPENPPADSFRLWTPSPRARLGWPDRWLPKAYGQAVQTASRTRGLVRLHTLAVSAARSAQTGLRDR